MSDESQQNAIPAPPVICDDCLASSAVRSPNGNVMAFYCHHNMAGGTYIRSSRAWRVYGPVSGAEFANALVLATLDAGWQANEKLH